MYVEIRELERQVAGEVLSVVGWSPHGLLGRALVRVIARPVRRFAEVAATCDRIVCAEGFVAAGRWTLSQFASGLEVEGAERVPRSGPVLILSSHPGSVEALALVAGAGRDDLKLVAWPMPFLRHLPNVSRHLIFAADEKRGRALAVRQGIHRLRRGGALLLFPRGRPEPDPATMGGAESELGQWSRSVTLFARSVPGVAVVPAVVGAVLAPRFVRHPVTRVFPRQLQRQRMAIVLQFLGQMRGKPVRLVPRVAFGVLPSARDLQGDLMDAITASVRDLLNRPSRHRPDPS